MNDINKWVNMAATPWGREQTEVTPDLLLTNNKYIEF